MPNSTVLLIDADGSLPPDLPPATLVVALRTVGADVLRVATGTGGLRALYDARPDAVVLPVDGFPPGGYETLARIREVSAVPVLMIGRRAGPEEDTRALMAGADDYIAPPVDPTTVAERVRRLVERSARARQRDRQYADGALEIDFAAVEVSTGDGPIDLTRLEFRILAALVTHAGQVLEQEQLLAMAWDKPVFERTRVKAHIASLRRKLGPAGRRIETVRGFGYRYRPPG